VTTAVLSPRARRDLLDAVRWIARDDPAAARAFRGAVASGARRLSEHAEIGFERPELADPPVRFLSLTGFPYLIVYDADRRPPLILRVLHGARDLPQVLRER
jgi:toxin ParE1/3/4